MRPDARRARAAWGATTVVIAQTMLQTVLDGRVVSCCEGVERPLLEPCRRGMRACREARRQACSPRARAERTRTSSARRADPASFMMRAPPHHDERSTERRPVPARAGVRLRGV
ncbi:Hypothetical protein A7982_02876 [Minicystis rosea]|nr:Hypothetical protein A7982_02876 [Minicystis rosea]